MSDEREPTAGVIGLGAMGRPAAEHLARAGLPTVAYDLDDAVRQAVAESGVRPARTLRELAAACTALFVFVPSDADVRAVCSGEDGLLAGARPGSVLLVCSSVTPQTCEDIRALAAPAGVAVLDAALTGGVRGAEAGAVNLMVGGEQEDLDRVRPLLEPWTSAVHHLGPLGAGQIGKTVNNLCHWAQISAITEALAFGARLGVEPSKLRTALMDGPADSRTLREIELMRFTWHVKDLANALQMAGEVGQPMPVAEVAQEAMTRLTPAVVAELLADTTVQRQEPVAS